MPTSSDSAERRMWRRDLREEREGCWASARLPECECAWPCEEECPWMLVLECEEECRLEVGCEWPWEEWPWDASAAPAAAPRAAPATPCPCPCEEEP